MKTYSGGCHCGAVRFEAELDLDKTITCNCSHCAKKGFILSAVDKDKFTLQTSEDMLIEYSFNTKRIRHLFCRVCGVQSYSEGTSFPKMMVNVRCLDDVDISTLSPEEYNGKDI